MRATTRLDPGYSAWTPFWFLAPAVGALLAIGIYPTLFAIVHSFREYQLTRPRSGFPFIGLGNYQTICSTARFANPCSSLSSSSWSDAFEIVLGLAVALLLHQRERVFCGRSHAFPGVPLARPMPSSASSAGDVNVISGSQRVSLVVRFGSRDWLGSHPAPSPPSPPGHLAVDAVLRFIFWPGSPWCPSRSRKPRGYETSSKWQLLKRVQLPYLLPDDRAPHSADPPSPQVVRHGLRHESRRAGSGNRPHFGIYPARRLQVFDRVSPLRRPSSCDPPIVLSRLYIASYTRK